MNAPQVQHQHITFHLQSDEVIFGLITKTGGEFFPGMSQAHSYNNLPAEKYTRHLPIEVGTHPHVKRVFGAMLDFIADNGRVLVKVNNPDGYDLISVSDQQELVGPQVKVVANEPL